MMRTSLSECPDAEGQPEARRLGSEFKFLRVGRFRQHISAHDARAHETLKATSPLHLARSRPGPNHAGAALAGLLIPHWHWQA